MICTNARESEGITQVRMAGVQNGGCEAFRREGRKKMVI